MSENTVEVCGSSYYMNPRLKSHWDKMKDGKLTKKDEDSLFIVDGREGVGKSLMALQFAAYIDPTIVKDLSRICFTADEFVSAVRNTRSDALHTKVILFDEAFRGMSGKSVLSKVNKQIIQVLQEMRQKNLVGFIVTPSFFMLEKYVAIFRTNALFHVVKSKKTGRRYWKVYNYKKKAGLYNLGMTKGWSYPIKTGFKDYFYNIYPGGKEFETAYRAKKDSALRQMDVVAPKTGVQTKQEAIKEYRESILLKILKEDTKLSFMNLAKYLGARGYPLKRTEILNLITKNTVKAEETGQSQPIINNIYSGEPPTHDITSLIRDISAENDEMEPETGTEGSDDPLDGANSTRGGSLPTN